ncbi:MAG TPA: class I SAM-dependent methyltransferase [Phycisphaerae bacterium]|nr:class I SAM-dependent methyltransferase [Phycisphaerae bacterium]
MGSMLTALRWVYRTIVPRFIRRSKLAGSIKRRVLWHDAIYDKKYYARNVESSASRSASTIADSIMADLAPQRVIDVGCGTGALLSVLRDRGCEVEGIENSSAALEYCRDRHLDVTRLDLESDVLDHPGTFDVVISMEVAEHLPEKVASRYVGLLASLGSAIVFTAATPGQGGTDHVNKQTPLYWIRKFQSCGFTHDELLSTRWRETWRASSLVERFYWKNIMVFRHTDKLTPAAIDS